MAATTRLLTRRRRATLTVRLRGAISASGRSLRAMTLLLLSLTLAATTMLLLLLLPLLWASRHRRGCDDGRGRRRRLLAQCLTAENLNPGYESLRVENHRRRR